MSLRRTALNRRSELRRITPMPRVKRELARRAAKTIKAQRNTGPSPSIRRLVAERADWCCEICGRLIGTPDGWTQPHSFHHRQPRGTGGSGALGVNSPANLMLLCGTGTTGCHGLIESQRADAYETGWLVRSGYSPAETTTTVAARDAHVYLTEDGRYLEVS